MITAASRCTVSAIWFANVSCSLPTCSRPLNAARRLEATLRLREELAEQRRALQQMQEMASRYGCDISHPARTAREAVQWLYFAYLAAVKSQNGGAMSLGRTATFLDIYIERDLRAGLLNEEQAQELIDHFIMKIRMVRFLRTPELTRCSPGIPSGRRRCWAVWGWMAAPWSVNHLPLPAYPAHHGPAPEPNLTVLWSQALPVAFKNMPPGSLSPPRRCSMRTTI